MSSGKANLQPEGRRVGKRPITLVPHDSGPLKKKVFSGLQSIAVVHKGSSSKLAPEACQRQTCIFTEQSLTQALTISLLRHFCGLLIPLASHLKPGYNSLAQSPLKIPIKLRIRSAYLGYGFAFSLSKLIPSGPRWLITPPAPHLRG